ncbi:MAG: glutamine--fructose-6-phosphate transaminase (isomerizing) [Candidatus Abyssobacteria bacterium SURF_17]|uniref:Glutamine--fructose-6-phosphate aminotransferase [isomerizing] n=1 Tax=Candidatus Abyssobacteria bacterium SURF_17 TaxID=2093361 RepID=A0A419ET88_9BACT|nr:MAG: glutamine--fructose-6-phosphate transaminase (isomerizing) [Candidatus Abyssubacteria bacterium SURF_17]
MCGIVGYVGKEQATPIIIEGLRRLEYRGYDSAGIALLNASSIHVVKEVGKLSALRSRLQKESPVGTTGIGHTRWATHGVPSEVNAHPHHDCTRSFMLVHNGIIENYTELRQELLDKGHRFVSETDTEVVVHLIEENYSGDLLRAMLSSMRRLKGAYAFAVIAAHEPDTIVAARCGSPLVVGVGNGCNLVASDASAVLSHTRRVVYLEDNHAVRLGRDNLVVCDIAGNEVEPNVKEITLNLSDMEKAGHPHFMIKEIFEQPSLVADVLMRRIPPTSREIDFQEARLQTLGLDRIRRVMMVSCGTACHASMVGKYYIEEFARLPVEVDVASEFRYRNPVITDDTLVIAISQSGETADTLAGVREARRRGAKVLSLINVEGSSIDRESDATLYVYAGPEIAVASTKAYTAQILALFLLALFLGRKRGLLEEPHFREVVKELRLIPGKMQSVLDNHEVVKICAHKFSDAPNFLYLGRSYNYPNALEGALKLKELSYIHAEGCGAGEMKHGPIALIDDTFPVVCLAPAGRVYEKMVSNMQEIRARRGILIAIATEGNKEMAAQCEHVISVPHTHEALSPLLTVIPLQLLAYYVTTMKGLDVDQPRNLAKSVTVE